MCINILNLSHKQMALFLILLCTIFSVIHGQDNLDEAAKREILEDEFCAAVGNKLNEYADVSSQEQLVKGYTGQSNAVTFVNNYRADGGKGTGELKQAVQYASTSQMTRYSENLIAYAAPGITFGVIMTFWWLIFTSCRMMKRCCLPKKPSNEYTKKEKYCPVFCYIFIGLLGAACSIIGLVYILQLSNTITGAICDVDLMRLDSGSFFNKLTKPLEDIESLFDKASNDVKNTIGTTGDGLDKGVLNMTTGLDTLGNDIKTKINFPTSLTGGFTTPSCLFCTRMAIKCQTASSEINNKAPNEIDNVLSVGNQLDKQVISGQNKTRAVVTKSKEINNLVIALLDTNLKTSTINAKASITPIKNNMSNSTIAFFGITFVAILFTLIGLFFMNCGKYTNCTGIKFIDDMDDWAGAYFVFLGWWLTSIAVIAMFFIAGALMPSSIAVSDVCVILNEFPQDMNLYLKRVVPGKTETDSSSVVTKRPDPNEIKFPDALQGCYNNESLFDVLNMSNAFNMKSSLNYSKSKSYDENKAFDFKVLTSLQSDIHGLTVAHFSFNKSVANLTNATINRYVNNTENYILNTIQWMKNDIDRIVTFKDKFKTDVKLYQTNLLKTQASLEPVNGKVEETKALTTCGFVKTHYLKITGRLCNEGLPAMLYVALACLLNAIFGIFMIWNGLLVNTRYGGHGKTADDILRESENGFGEDEFSRIEEEEEEGEENDLEEGDGPPPPPPDEEDEKKEEKEKEETKEGYATEEYVHIGSPGADRGWNEEEYVVYDDEEDELHYMEEADHEAETGLI